MGKEFPNPRIEQSDKYEIIEGDVEQLEKIVSVNQEIFRGMYEQEPYSIVQYRKRLEDLQPKIFIAESGGRIVGDSISFDKDGSWYIWIMGVLKEHRNKGIATKLFENNEQFAKDNSYRSITVKVYKVSEEMFKMLLARGYQITGVDQSEKDQKYDAVHLELKF